MLLRVDPLPDDPLAAAAQFHAVAVPHLLAALGGAEPAVTLVFAPAGHAHEDWRRAAIATLARARSPLRINAVASDDEAAIAATAAFIAAAPGLTGQYLVLDPTGAGAALDGPVRP